MAPRRARGEWRAGISGAVVLVAVAGCTPQHGPAGRHATRPLAVHPVDRLLARPAPLDVPESYGWTDRARLQADLQHHLADLCRQSAVLRTGLKSAAGPAPQETLLAIRRAEDEVVVQLARMGAATAQSWPGVRLDLLDAVRDLGRVIERARHAAWRGAATITI